MTLRVGRLALSLASALALAASQLHGEAWPLGAVALVPWLASSARAGRLEAIGLGALVGTAFASVAVGWIPEALGTLGSRGLAPFAGLVLTAAASKAPLFAATGLLARELRGMPVALRALGLGAVFGAGEAWIGTTGLGVPGAFVGHGQREAVGVAQLAVVGGVPLISAGLVALNAAFSAAVPGSYDARRLAAALAAGWLACAVFGLPVARAVRPSQGAGGGVTLLLVQPDIAREARWNLAAQPRILARMVAYTTRALGEVEGPVDAVVWPENLLTAPLEHRPELQAEIEAAVDAWRVPLITGLVRAAHAPGTHRYRSSVVWIAPGRGLVAAIDKVRGVPLIESARPLPCAAWLAPLFGEAARWPKVEEAASAGALAGGFSVSPVLCYEVLFPGLVAGRRTEESVALLNLADDGWVAGSAATRQLTAWASFRAIEQRLPLVRVAHGGLSVVIDEYGRMRQALPLDRFAHAVARLGPRPPPTWSERAAIFAVPLGTALVVWWGLGGGLGRNAMRARVLLSALLLSTLAAVAARAEPTLATLTLDGLSFVSFQDEEVLPLAAGSTLQLRFGDPLPSGDVPFTILPGDVSIAPIALADGRTLTYGLAAPASGVLRETGGDRILEFQGAVAATLGGGAGAGTFTYSMPFTTETVSATNALGTHTVQVTGLRLVDGVWYAQLVGATVNRNNAFPKPGAAVYTVLSGQFDQLP